MQAFKIGIDFLLRISSLSLIDNQIVFDESDQNRWREEEGRVLGAVAGLRYKTLQIVG